MNGSQIENETLQHFWDGIFKSLTPRLVTIKDLDLRSPLKEEIVKLAHTSSSILDIGCGEGSLLLYAGLNYSSFKGVGIDSSPSAITFANKMAELNHIGNISFLKASLPYLQAIPTNSINGIICSNFLDVIPQETSLSFIKEIKRILSRKGELILKVNFFITPEIAKKHHFVLDMDQKLYIDGVLQGCNFSSSYWIEAFKPLHLLRQEDYQRLNDGPNDRLFIFVK